VHQHDDDDDGILLWLDDGFDGFYIVPVKVLIW
jgi:hypothetical protein